MTYNYPFLMINGINDLSEKISHCRKIRICTYLIANDALYVELEFILTMYYGSNV
jgi:hypothetical protein